MTRGATVRCKMCRSMIIHTIIIIILTISSYGFGMPQELLYDTESLEQYSQSQPEPELDVFNCPTNCVCQYDAFKELPIARWVNHMIDTYEDELHIKLATCLLQDNSDTLGLLSSLPMDLQALILLHTGSTDSQVMVNTSSLKPLNQLTTLEIRGTGATLIIDEPLEFLQHANFEQIQVQASERLQRAINIQTKLSNDNYIYTLPSDLNATKNYEPKSKLQFEEVILEEILSYEQHMQKLKLTRMPTFKGWARLEVLRIQDCHLEEIHWQTFDGLQQLTHLSLERNNIVDLPPFAFAGALHLKSLSLAHNFIDRMHYLGLAGLLELQNLNLADNLLEFLNEASFPPFPKLKKIDLRKNPVRNIYPATFWVMNNTRELQMGSNVTALELGTMSSYGQFDSLHKLRTLSLSNVTAGNLEQGVFKGLNSLETLMLRGSIKSIQFDTFAGMEQLRELDLSECGILELSMDALMGIQRLEILKLAHNNLTNIPPGLLDDQQQLEEVHLQGNQLKTLPKSFFYQPRLRVARLDLNPWQCSCDMSTWLQRLTNRVRGPSVETCVKDINGEPIACRHVPSFEVDKNLVPRCANYNGRSVYYVLRRQLHCDAMLILKTRSRMGKTRGLPHWRKLELQQQGQAKPNRTARRQHKPRKSQRNNLDFVLKQQQQHPMKRSKEESQSVELSNEI
ncbi:insulin-like growth factor-binding protein complex acid labile subunit [Drosophila tropicalis]|uniref:insulin-like growth factor-binding protein complex acid labile subunit n=1 Tax=Drosophila tropicalis TaxID=46794 RepID=UPI0035AB8A2C